MALQDLIQQICSSGTLQLPNAAFENSQLLTLIQDLYGTDTLTITGLQNAPTSPVTSGNQAIYSLTTGSVVLPDSGTALSLAALVLFADDAASGPVNVALQYAMSDVSATLPQLLTTLSGLAPTDPVNTVFSSSGTASAPLTNIINGLGLVAGITCLLDNQATLADDGIFVPAADVLELIPDFPSLDTLSLSGYVRFATAGDLLFGTTDANVTAQPPSNDFNLLYLEVSAPQFLIMPVSLDGESGDQQGGDDDTGPLMALGYALSLTLANTITLEAVLTSDSSVLEFMLKLNGSSAYGAGQLDSVYALMPSEANPQTQLTGLSFLSDSLSTIEKYVALDSFSLSVMFDSSGPSLLSMQATVSMVQSFTLAGELNVQNLSVNWSYASYGQDISLDVTLGLVKMPLLGYFEVIIDSNGLLTGQAQGPIKLGTLLDGVSSSSTPEGWEETSFDDLNLVYDIGSGMFGLSGVANADVGLFGKTELLGAKNMNFNVQYTPGQTGTWQVSFNGILDVLGLDLQINAQIGTSTVISLQLTDHTLGDLVSYIASLVSSGGFSLTSPWDVLNDIHLDDFVLTFDVTNQKVTFAYDANEDFGFIQLSGIGIIYDYSSTATESFKLYLGGDFLGQSYPMQQDGSSNLGWSPMTQPGPAVPGKSTLLDLRMLGFGQRLTLKDAEDIGHVAEAMDAIKKSFTPPSGGQNLPPALLFDPNAGWLLGADFTVLDTVSVQAVFDDPALYGLNLSLAGAKAGNFAGLDFEVIYKQVGDGVGEYSLWLTLPKAMQQLSLGEVNITLPIIGLSIYTNGDFLIDLGYPYNNDYSKSFMLNVFPLVGVGGLYFGMLSSATAPPGLVPDTNNTGLFNPIIELGLAMKIGVGYQGTYGPLSFSAGLTVTGSLIGVMAFFHPYDPSYPSSSYFNIQGSIGIDAWLKGGVNFGIVSASIDLEIDAFAGLTYVSYQPMQISLSAEVKASAEAKILFIKVHFSFDVTVSKTFTVGSASAAPWDTIPPRSTSQALPFALAAASLPSTDWTWPAGFDYPLPANFAPELYVTPIVTASADSGTPNPRIVAALMIENPNPEDLSSGSYVSGTPFGVLCQAMLAWGLAAYLGQSSWDDLQSQTVSAIDLARMQALLSGELNAETLMQLSFSQVQAQMILHSLLMQGVIDANNRVVSVPDALSLPDLSFVSATDLQHITQVLTAFETPAQLFSEEQLEAYLETLFSATPFSAVARPSDAGSSTIQTTIFPLPAELSFSASGATQVMANQSISDPGSYSQLLNAYFAQTGNAIAGSLPTDEGDSSVAALVFRDYFYLLLTAAIQQASQLIAAYPYAAAGTDTLSSIVEAFNPSLGDDPDALASALEVLVEANLEATDLFDTDAGWVVIDGYAPLLSTGMTLSGLTAEMYVVPAPGQPVGATLNLADVAALNQDLAGLLVPGQVITMPNLSFTPQAAPTLSQLQSYFAMSPPTSGQQILVRNGATPTPDVALAPLTQLQITGISFMVQDYPAYDTVAAISAAFGISPAQLRRQNPGLPADDTATLDPTQQIAIASLNYTVPPNDIFSILSYFNPSDASALQPTLGQALTLTAQYTVQPGDTLFGIAAYLGTDVATLSAAIGGLNLSPQLRPALPAFAHRIAAGDSFASLAHGFGLSLSAFAALNAQIPFFAAGAMLSLVPEISVANLVAALDAQTLQSSNAPGTATIARSLNRFLLNGLRLPLPDTSTIPTTPAEWAAVATEPLYSLTGQQFDVASPIPGSISFSLSGSLSWVASNDLSVELCSDELSLVASAVTQLQALAPAMPAALTGWSTRQAVYAFGTSESWSSPEPQAFAQALPSLPPLVWSFSSELSQALTQAASQSLSLTPSVSLWSQGALGAGSPPAGYAWAAQIELGLRPVQTVSSSSGPAGNVFSLSLDQDVIDSLAALEKWLSGSGNGVSLNLLYLAGGDLRSDIASDADRATISVVTLANTDAPQATLSNPLAFVTLLQQADYLDYVTAATPDGLPAALFANQLQGTVSLLVTIDCNAAGSVPAWCNTLLTTGEVRSSGGVLTVTATDLLQNRPNLQPGNLAFATAAMSAPDDSQPIAQLYQLLSYTSVDAAGQALDTAGTPIPPSQPDGDDSSWTYKKSIALTSSAGSTDSSGFSAAPPAALNPYRQIGPSPQNAYYSFNLVDLFGNAYHPSSLATALTIPLSYYDPMLPVASWPSCALSYDFSSGDDSPLLNLYLNFSAAKYQLSPAQSIQSLLTRINSDLQSMAQVWYQLKQPDISLELNCSVGSVSSLSSDDLGNVRNFVTEVYAYLASLIYLNEQNLLTQGLAQTLAGDTLSAAATRTSTDVSALAAMNLNLAGLPLANATINLPLMYPVVQGDSLSQIAAKTGTDLGSLATLNAGSPLSPGLALTVGQNVYTTLSGDTLASIAQAFGVAGQSITPAQIAADPANAQLTPWPAGTLLIGSLSSGTVQAGDSLWNLLQDAVALATASPQPTLDALLQANAAAGLPLSEGLSLSLPQHTVLDSSALPKGLAVSQPLAQASSLADLSSEALDQADYWYANADRSDVLDAGQSLSFSAGLSLAGRAEPVQISASVTIQANDTPQTLYMAALAALAAAIQAQKLSGSASLSLGDASVDLTLTPNQALAQIQSQLQNALPAGLFALLIAQATIFAANSVLLAPPQALTLQGTVTPTLPAAFAEISASLLLQRDASLVNSQLPAAVVPLVSQALSPASPQLNPSGSLETNYNQQSLSLAHFAENFQNLFPAYLVGTPPRQSGSQVQLYAVPLGKDAVEYVIRPETAAYFLNPPLATSLMSAADVQVPSYSSAGGLDTQNSTTVNLQGVDLDLWASQFLSTFDQIFAPRALATIYSSAPDDFASLLQLRETLVTNIAASVAPVTSISGSDPADRLQAAQSAFADQLAAALSNAYRIDSIVQLATELSPQAAPTTISATTTLQALADQLGLALPEFIAANYSCNLLSPGASVTIDEQPLPITDATLNLSAWFSSLSQTQQAWFLDGQQTPAQTAELTQLGAQAGFLVEPTGGQLIGKGAYSTNQTAYGFSIQNLNAQSPHLVQIGNAFGPEPGGFNASGFALPAFYVAELLKDVQGLFNGSAIQPSVLPSLSNPDQPVTFGPSDSLQSVYDANYQGQTLNDQPVTLWDLAQLALGALIVDPKFSQPVLYFTWTTLADSALPDTSGLSFSGKPVNSSASVPQAAGANSLKGLLQNVSPDPTHPLEVVYLGLVLANQPGIFNGQPLQGFTVTPQPTDSLQSLYDQVQTSALTYEAFISAIADQPILIPNLSLPLFWQRYGQILSLTTAAAALGVDTPTLIWANYNNPVWNPDGSGQSTTPVTLSKFLDLWAPNLVYPAANLPAEVYEAGYLQAVPVLGVLAYVSQGGDVFQTPSAGTSFNDFVTSLSVTTIRGNALFAPTYIADLLQAVPGLFSGNLNNQAGDPIQITDSDTLATIAAQYYQLQSGTSVTGPQLAQFVTNQGDALLMSGQSVSFQWTALVDVVQAPTLQQIADYFNAAALDVIEANWNQPGLIAPGVQLSYGQQSYKTGTADTFANVLEALTGSSAFPPDPALSENVGLTQNPQLLLPYTQPGLLVLQPGVALGSAGADLRPGEEYLTFVMSQSGQPQRRIGLDLAYQPVSVLADATVTGGEPLQLQLLSASAAPIGSLEVPIPLRSYPNAPGLVSQAGTQIMPAGGSGGEDQPLLALSAANQYSYSFSYLYQASSQDETQLSLLLNGGSGGTQAASGSGNQALLTALAAFEAVLPALMPDLNLLAAAGGLSNSPNLLNAISAFVSLAGPIAAAWNSQGGSQASSQSEQDTAAGGGETFSFVVEELYDGDNQELLISVSAPANQTLPGGYSLPLVAPDPGLWQPAGKQTPPLSGSQTQYVYQLRSGQTPAEDSGYRQVSFYNPLNVLAYPSAAGAISILRNQDLLYGAATNPAFVYQTPAISFQQPVSPLIDQSATVSFFPLYRQAFGLREQYTAYLTQLFAELFGFDWTSLDPAPEVQLAVNYRLSLASSGMAALTVLVPLALQGRSPLSSALIDDLAATLEAQRVDRGLSSGLFEFDLSLYQNGQAQPVLRLQAVQMPLDAQPIQTRRFLPPASPNLAVDNNIDAFNPLVVNASRQTDVTVNTVLPGQLAYGDPIKLKSWFSGMAWADNTTLYYNGGTPYRSRQTPVYADPLIGLYVCQLNEQTLRKGLSPNYLDYFSQNGAIADSDAAVYVQDGWEAGFHLAMPNPTLDNSAAFNSGTGAHTYNNDALVFNAGLSGYSADAGTDWVAATTTSPFPPDFTDFTTTQDLPETAFQAGLCQYAIWRDTLCVSPVAVTESGQSLAFAPNAAQLAQQGDFHARFVMANDLLNAPNQMLSMTLTQGSPLTQFIAAGLDGARIAGIFNPVLAQGSQVSLTPGGIYPATPGTITGLSTAGGGSGEVQYLIIYQQVNLMHSEQIPELGNPRKNWVSFAIFWDPSSTSASIDSDNLAVTLLFDQPQLENPFVVAGLPNQMGNSFDPGTDVFDSSVATAWAEAIGAVAFNIVESTAVSYSVGADASGAPAAANQVYTNYSYGLNQLGPVAAPNQTVILLQPHQYLDPFDPQGTVLVPGALQPLFSSGAPSADRYWIARGRLSEQLGADFSIVYTYPNLMPMLPMFPTDATQAIPSTVTLPSQPKTPPTNYNLLEMAAAIIGDYWVADFPDSAGNPQTAPATTGMANPDVMQDTYNSAKTFFRAAKMLPMLQYMTTSQYFNSGEVMGRINGSTIYNGGTSLYAVGANVQNGQLVYYTPGGALHDFIDHLITAYDFYFGGTPLDHLAMAVSGGQAQGQSFYYSYYDAKNHHVFLYPAAGAGGTGWPSNAISEATPIFDGYGTVSMLNDHAYTYGYFITAASLLAMVLQTDLNQLSYLPINSRNGQISSTSQPVATLAEYQSWRVWLSSITPVIDSLIMDLAYTPALDTGDAQGFRKLPGQSFPAMEFLDQWTGISWTDGFLQSGSIAGHNANSPWEEMLAWVGVMQWGYVTNRQALVDLGIYLYTTALYSLEYYNYNVPQNYLPAAGGDYSANADFIPRAMNDFAPAFSFYPKNEDGSYNTTGTYNPLSFVAQPFQGRAMSETMMSDSSTGALATGLYGLSGANDHRTAHVTYFYQGQVRSDNTYWNSPVGMLSTSIYPQGAHSLALARHPGYMSDWVNAIHFQNQRSYFQSFYPTAVNLLSALLGQSVSVYGKDMSSSYATWSSQANGTVPIPLTGGTNSGTGSGTGPGPANYAYSPTSTESGSNPQTNAFMYLYVNDAQPPYTWYWDKAAGINLYQSAADKGNPPWKSVSTGETLSMYVSPDQTEAETLLYFYSFDAYGVPDFSRTVTAAWTDSSTPGTPLLPMAAAWSKQVAAQSGDSGDTTTQWTYMVYNPNAFEISVSFSDGAGGSSQTQTCEAHQLLSWSETDGDSGTDAQPAPIRRRVQPRYLPM